ncbi:MAG: ATP-binding protein [Rhodospirillaceae bacterium]|nr:ATP-binding protein [Rhodospirillaceae bacterium]
MDNIDPEALPQSLLVRIASALERISPAPASNTDLSGADAFVWQPAQGNLAPVKNVNRVDIDLLRGIEAQCETLIANTVQFAKGFGANNALLWGARGTGKSSLVKAVHGKINSDNDGTLVLVEIHREDITTLPALLDILRGTPRRVILFCDDLSFDEDDAAYKSLKAVLEGGIEGRPENVIFYATSNRRHLMPRDMIENERSSAINPAEAIEEKVSLSDRFGLWLGFHNLDQDTYFEIIESYAKHFDLDADKKQLRARALEWSMGRGARSGRVAWQFIQDMAGRQGKKLD